LPKIKGVDLMKKLSIFTLTLFLFASLFTGCDISDKKALFDALQKTKEIKSLESKSNLVLKMDISGMPTEDIEQLKAMLPIGQEITIQTNQKLSSNQEKTISNAQIDLAIETDEVTYNTSIWSKTNLTNQPPEMKQIIKLPSQAKDFMPHEYIDKDYLVIDTKDLDMEEDFNMDEYNDLTESVTDLQNKIIAFVKDYSVNVDPGFAVVTYQGVRNLEGRNLKTYELKLTDESFKKLLKHSVNYLSNNETSRQMLEETFMALVDASIATETEDTMNAAHKKFTNGKTTFSQDLNTIINAFDNVKLLGNRGMTVSLGIDENGFIVNESGFADFVINTTEIEKAFKNASGAAKTSITQGAVFTLSTDFNTDTTKINEFVNINFPETNSDNSFTLEDIMGAF
jgi:hypothetical protein